MCAIAEGVWTFTGKGETAMADAIDLSLFEH